ncbi:MAG: carboxypeptidase regulatory-like domain-containing protein [Vicinamibacterales bacterium]
MRRLVAVLLVVTVVAAGAADALAQGFTGGLRGAVRDADGVVPGVTVTLTNDATGVVRSTQSNGVGEYTFPNLPSGAYSLQASLQGFKTYRRGGLTVATQQFLTIDITLELGTLTETVNVTQRAPVIDRSTASIGTVLDRLALQTLPSAGRNAFMLGTTVPTVVPSGDAQFNRQQDQTNASLASLGGGTRRGNNYTLDGVPITDLRNRQAANPTIEALDDLNVQVHTYDAEMARTGGGVFNATLRSGANIMRGSGFFQTRPVWGQTNNYFSDIAGRPKPQSPYYLGGGGVGGPIVRNRTFFWFAAEAYTDTQTRNASELMPTSAERRGDFSATTNAAGQPVIIYDPLTRRPFPGNVIPSERLNPVALEMTKYLPLPDVEVDNGSANYTRTSLIKTKGTQQYTGKIEHKVSDAISLSGFYLWNKSEEPCANYFGTADQSDPNRFADPADYRLKRRPQIVAINNSWMVSRDSMLALRFGWTDFPDDDTLSLSFDPSTLGFSPTYLNQITVQKFPSVRIRGYDTFRSQTLGAMDPVQRRWYSTSFNGSYTRAIGRHMVKVGGDYRRLGLDFFSTGGGAGDFDFDKDITSSNGSNTSTTDGNAFASFLLGLPSALPNRQSRITLSTPVNIYAHYAGGYLQDDWRVGRALTLTYGLRLEHETGMAERNDNFTVGFDRAVTNALSSVVIPADALAGVGARTVTGGLLYAGVDGNRRTQGNPPAVKWSPRVGAAYALGERTVLRGGYGIYWAPYNYPPPSASQNNYGQVGYTQNTILVQNAASPTTTLTNPFPSGLVPTLRNSLGTLSGVGTNVSYVDQDSGAPRVQQYSVDLQHQLPGEQAITVSYIGSRGDHLSLGGTQDTPVNINQLDPRFMALGPALLTSLPNPFFGHPDAGPFASRPTLTRQQLLRPFPQFGDIMARHVLEGKSRYNAAVVEWTRRPGAWLGGRVSYTYSRLMDNQMGETNFTSGPTTGPNPLNHYNYMAWLPRCTTTNAAACYNPDAEYAVSLLDVPHRVILAPIAELPFGRGRRFGSDNRLVEWLAGGWTVSAAIHMQSGFPIPVIQGDNTGTLSGTQRPNLVPGVPLETPGSYADRLASADHPTATWLNPAAFSAAAAYTYGNAPRTLTDVRTPGYYNVDAKFIKTFRRGGQMAQVTVEILNLLNRVNVRTLNGRNIFGNSNFGQTASQAGFMRIAQFMVRYSF